MIVASCCQPPEILKSREELIVVILTYIIMVLMAITLALLLYVDRIAFIILFPIPVGVSKNRTLL